MHCDVYMYYINTIYIYVHHTYSMYMALVYLKIGGRNCSLLLLLLLKKKTCRLVFVAGFFFVVVSVSLSAIYIQHVLCSELKRSIVAIMRICEEGRLSLSISFAVLCSTVHYLYIYIYDIGVYVFRSLYYIVVYFSQPGGKSRSCWGKEKKVK